MALYSAIPPECHNEELDELDEYDLEMINFAGLGPAYFMLVPKNETP